MGWGHIYLYFRFSLGVYTSQKTLIFHRVFLSCRDTASLMQTPLNRRFFPIPMPKIIPINDIKILDDRQRQEFNADDLQALFDSIAEFGLLHPPVVTHHPEGYQLVAGERRLRAVKMLNALDIPVTYGLDTIPAGKIPVTVISSTSELRLEEIEFTENEIRANLTWAEKAKATQRLHLLKQKQSAVRVMAEQGVQIPDKITPDMVKTYSSHTIADTAALIHDRSDGGYQNSVKQELAIAKHLDDPQIAKAKSLKEASKILAAKVTAKQNAALAASVGQHLTKSSHTLVNADCLEWMQNAEPGQFDVILTDPPYGMGADAFGDGNGRLTAVTHEYKDDATHFERLLKPWCSLAFKLAKEQAHAYIFCDVSQFLNLKSWMEEAGWYVFRTPIVYHKINSGRVPLPELGPRRQYELVLYAIKGKKKVTHIYPDVYSATGDEQQGHGAQKPIACFQGLLQRSVRPGDTILDTFAGTGTIIPAAHGLQCIATAIELNKEYFGICVKRLDFLEGQEASLLIDSNLNLKA